MASDTSAFRGAVGQHEPEEMLFSEFLATAEGANRASIPRTSQVEVRQGSEEVQSSNRQFYLAQTPLWTPDALRPPLAGLAKLVPKPTCVDRTRLSSVNFWMSTRCCAFHPSRLHHVQLAHMFYGNLEA